MQTIKEIIDNHLKNSIETKCSTAANYNKFRVSDSGKCKLYRFWKRKGLTYTNLPAPSNIRRTKLGTIIHEWLEKLFAEAGMLIASEQVVENEHIRGSFDMVLDLNGMITLVDIKTIWSIKKPEYLFKPEYFLQAMTYKWLLPYKVDAVKILYIDISDLEEILIPVPDEYEEKAIQDWNEMIKLWEQNKQPEPEVGKLCQYCVYKDLCKQSFPEYHK